MMHVYGYFRSSAAYRLRIALNLKDLPHEFTSVHLRKDGGQQNTAEYVALNPQRLVPTVTEGNFTLSQSLAILEWLEERFPAPPILPGDINLRAEVRALANVIACDIHPLQNLRVLQYLRSEFGADKLAEEKWLQRWLGDGLKASEAMLTRPGNRGDFCFGNFPSMADICLVPQVFSANRFSLDLSSMPRILEIVAACEELEAFSRAHPSRQPDAEV